MEAELVFQYFPDLSETQKAQLSALGPLYKEWNEKINVISRKDIDQLYLRHVLHSLAIQKFTSFSPGQRVLDVGTGGGFPGIPLAILNPQTKFHLVDSIAKKITVVDAVKDSLGLPNVTAEHKRVEKLKPKYDTVVTRAVAQTNKLLSWISNIIDYNSKYTTNNGLIALKGGELTVELSQINRPYQMVSISEYFNEEFFDTKKIVFVPF